MPKRGFRIIGITSIFIGAVLLLNSFTITSFAILEDITKTTGSILGLVLVIGGLIIFQSGTTSRDDDEGGLEKALFVWDRPRGKPSSVKMNDPTGDIRQDLGYTSLSVPAVKTLRDLHNKYYEDKEMKEILEDQFEENGFFRSAYQQRDDVPEIQRGTPAFFADEFLKEWDPNYKEFIPRENHLLTYEEDSDKPHLNVDAGVYNSHEFAKILQKNVGEIVYPSGLINGDIPITYRGSQLSPITADHTTCNLEQNSIAHTLRRIARAEVNMGLINDTELGTRIRILKKEIYGEN